MTVVPCRAKTHPLRPRRSCFAPSGSPGLEGEEMVEAPGTAPGSDGFITIAIYRHSRCRHAQYRRWCEGMQMMKGEPCGVGAHAILIRSKLWQRELRPNAKSRPPRRFASIPGSRLLTRWIAVRSTKAKSPSSCKDGSRIRSRFERIRGSTGPDPTTDQPMTMLRGDD